MAEVYIISTTESNNQYVGKTNNTSQERFLEHLKEAAKTKQTNRPLYNSIRKYGPSTFSVRTLAKGLLPHEANEIEIDMIYKYDTFNNGYNATRGGDGNTYRLVSDKDIAYIIDLYTKEGRTLEEIALELNSCYETVSRRLKENGIIVKQGGNQSALEYEAITIEMNHVKTNFTGVEALVDYFLDNGLTTATKRVSVRAGINRAIRGDRDTYLGYKINLTTLKDCGEAKFMV